MTYLITSNQLSNSLLMTLLSTSNGTDVTGLQQDLDKFAKWEEIWQMEFHPQKCSVLHITRSHNPKYKQYTLHGHILIKEDTAKTLSWNNHINEVTKSKCILGFPTKKSQNWPGKLKTSAYFTLVRPQLEMPLPYGTPTHKCTKTK